MRKLIVASVVLLAVAQPLLAEELCVGGPREQWLTEADVAARLSEMGYSDFLLAVEDGCLEAKLVHEGKRVEIYMEPVTGEVVLVKED